MDQAIQRGYLKENFRFFHLRDSHAQTIDYHYHEFDKVVIFLSGSASYIIEGRTYRLQPWDILLIPHHDIHRPLIDASAPYERMVIWVDPVYLQRISTEKTDLSRCFALAEEKQHNLCRPAGETRAKLSRILETSRTTMTSEEFGFDLLQEAVFIELMVLFNRLMLSLPEPGQDAFEFDPKISEVLRYINTHLTEDLSIDMLSGRFYMSRYHFMRKFKEITGYTAHSYVRQKRLAYASDLIMDGAPPSQAAEAAGFCDYSSFLRAFKQQFSVTPREFAQNTFHREEIID